MEQTHITIGLCIVVIGAFWRLASTLMRIETMLQIYVKQQEALERRVRHLEERIHV